MVLNCTKAKVCDIISDEILAEYQTEQEAVDAACDIRQTGNYNVKVILEIPDGQANRRQKIAERETAARARRSEVHESGRDGEANVVHSSERNDSSSGVT